MGCKPTYINAPRVRYPDAHSNRAESFVYRPRYRSTSSSRRSSSRGRTPPPRYRHRSTSRSRHERLQGSRYDDHGRREIGRTSSTERLGRARRPYREISSDSRYASRDLSREGRRINEVLQKLDDINSSLATVSSGLTETRNDLTPPLATVSSGSTDPRNDLDPPASGSVVDTAEVKVPPPPTLSSPASPSPATAPAVEVKVEVDSGPTSQAIAEPSSPSPVATTPTSLAASVFSARSSSAGTSSSSVPGEPTADDVRRELQDIQQQMSALAAREIALVTQLEQFGECELDASQVQIKKADDSISNFIGDSPASEQCTQEVPDSEVEAIHAQLHVALEEQRAAYYAARHELRRRVAAENALADIRRECSAPFVVPALMDAFIRISALADATIPVDDPGSEV
ncbi:hypothetical protein C8Q72DRAFT_493565 [Fomitopsis betulina]|nr:hypothetical protein C8Q72DRAFT_493565 [Fomitopsis betulina]